MNLTKLHLPLLYSALAGLAGLMGTAARAEIISYGNLNPTNDPENPSVGYFANTVGTIVYSLDTATGNVWRSGTPTPDTGINANQWLWTAISGGFAYDGNGGSGGAGDGAFVPTTGSFVQNFRAVLQFAADGKTTTGSQTFGMDVFRDDNTLDNDLTFRVELYAWNGASSPGLSVGGSTTAYNTTALNGATTILDTTVDAADDVAEAAWQTVTLGTVDLGSGYDFYAWRIGVLGQTDGDVFKFDNVTVSAATPAPFKITSFTSIDRNLGIWQVTLAGASNTAYVFRSSTTLDFSSGTLVENLTPGVPAAGAMDGANDSVVTTDGSGNATVRMTLTGDPSDFIRAESAP